MNILYLNERYGDTLLALGIAAAFDVQPQYTGSSYVFPEVAADPIRFPVRQLEGETFDPPFNYHRFKWSAVTAFAGFKLLQQLEASWNASEPTYEEVMRLILRLDEPDWQSTRFWQVENRTSGSATFRPLSIKGQNSTKADGVRIATPKEFWLYDALRAIGFLTFAQPKLLPQEAQTSRWMVFVPVEPVFAFSDTLLRQPDSRTNIATQILAHLIASEMEIPEVRVAKYAELNPKARTIMSVFDLQPLALSQTAIEDIRRFVYSSSQLHIAKVSPLLKPVLDALDGSELRNLHQITTTPFLLNVQGARLHTIGQNTLSELITCEPLKNSRLA